MQNEIFLSLPLFWVLCHPLGLRLAFTKICNQLRDFTGLFLLLISASPRGKTFGASVHAEGLLKGRLESDENQHVSNPWDLLLSASNWAAGLLFSAPLSWKQVKMK